MSIVNIPVSHILYPIPILISHILTLIPIPVKGVNFYGLRSEYVVSGSDCGHVFVWDKETQDIVQWLEADQEGVVRQNNPHCNWLSLYKLPHPLVPD